jgi:hypothetical protein
VVSTLTPAYTGTVQSQAAWGGHPTSQGWQYVTADLTAWAGQPTVRLQFGFASDSSVVYPGAYIDDLVVAEDGRLPIYLTTTALPSGFAEVPYTTTVTQMGATSVVWSLPAAPAWLSIDPATGVITGTPPAGSEGIHQVTVRVESALQATIFAEQTYDLRILHQVVGWDFEGACPNGWTLTSEWQCGTPSSVGPATAHSGAQCLGTVIAGNYSNGLTWAGTNATSPAIDLTGTTAPQAMFYLWVDTEGSTYDGANLKVSTDGTTFSIVTGVTPAYNLTVDSQSAWGGHQSTSGWQLVTADLSAFAGQTIYLRFGFRSDSSVQYPGVYLDDLSIVD